MKSLAVYVVAVALLFGMVVSLRAEDKKTTPLESLFEGIKTNSTKTVYQMLQKDPSLITAKSPRGETVLHVASEKGNTELVRYLLKNGADIQALTVAKNKAIHFAASEGRIDTVRVLLEKGALVNEPNASGLFPVQYAVASGVIPLVELLIKNGASYSTETPGKVTLLHFAAQSGSVAMYDFIASKGLSATATDARGRNVLHHASMGSVEMVRYLLSKGFSVKDYDMWEFIPAVTACFWGKKDIVDYYIHNGLGINEKFGTTQQTLLHIIASFGPPEMISYLIAKGADVNAINGNNETVLAMAAMNNKVANVKLLIEQGASIAPKDCDGTTQCAVDVRIPLHLAAFSSVEMVQCLLDAGADINIRNHEGENALFNSIYADKNDIAQYLIQKNITVNVRNTQGMTPLHIAVDHGNSAIVSALLAANADVNARNEKGVLPLHIAAQKGYSEIAKLLLQHNSLVNEKDNNTHTPYYYADYCGNESVKALLLTAGAKKTDIGKKNNTLMTKELKTGESVVWFLGHSGWAIKTKKNLLIIDYFENGTPSDIASLFNGRVNADELKDMNVTVFVSHTHADHYSPAIVTWKEKIPSIQYVFGFDDPKATVPYVKMTQRETKVIGDLKVSTIEANDSGVGFLIEADGVVLFHVGDHANRTRDLSGNYCPEIDYIAGMNKKIDLLFLPVSGCGFGDLEAVKKGDFYAIQKLQPRMFIPMHGDNNSFESFIDSLKNDNKKIRTFLPKMNGDRLLYSR